MQSVVVSIGGSVILSEDADTVFLEKLGTLLTKLSKRYKLFIIVGGGTIARSYIQRGRELKFDEEFLDQIGINITRVNARLLTNIIKLSNKEIPATTDEAKKIDKPTVVMGGTTPGHSTDMVGAELAEKTNASRFVIATDVNGIYNKDPNKYRDAKQLKEVAIDQLIQQYGTTWDAAGKNIVIDNPALEIIKRAKLRTSVVNGKQLDQLEKAITGQPFDGTTITF